MSTVAIKRTRAPQRNENTDKAMIKRARMFTDVDSEIETTMAQIRSDVNGEFPE